MKKCPRCKKLRPLVEFSLKSKEKGARQPYCKTCNIEYHLDHYRKNKRDYVLKAQVYKNKMRDVIRKLKEITPCTDCGQLFPYYVADYDHKFDKIVDIARMVSNGYSLKNIFAEIAKCDLVCANCHRIRTHKRHNGSFV